jgi:hypothetical protein
VEGDGGVPEELGMGNLKEGLLWLRQGQIATRLRSNAYLALKKTECAIRRWGGGLKAASARRPPVQRFHGDPP